MIRFVKHSALPALTVEDTEKLSDRVEIKEFFAKAVKEWKGTEFSLDISKLTKRLGCEAVRDMAEGILLGTFQTMKYPPTPRTEWNIELTGGCPEAEAILKEVETLAEGVFWTRDMTNRPGNLLRPAMFAQEAKKLLAGLPVEVELLEQEQMEQLGMYGILGIGLSSEYPPCLCVLRYQGAPESDSVTGLAGKGVTCDSGGYCLKGASSMKGIKGDMAGGAAVAGAIYALAKNRAAVNVTGVIPMVENRISSGSLLPGDVITSYSGKTIEVLNTDAEGRLVLADAVAYAVRAEHVSRIVDIATLTGTVCASLGFGAAGAICDNEALYEDFMRAYEKSGERYVRFPIYEEYHRLLKSDVADIKNVGGQFAGMITAGLFIGSFSEQTPWLHLDIAGTAWTDPPVFEYQTKGASGAGLTTLYYLCAGKE